MIDIKFGKTSQVLLKVAALSTATLAVIGVYTFYRNNIWHPKVDVLDVDFKNGIARLNVNGKPFTLKGDSQYLVAANYGVKFGYTYLENGKRVYDRIEILKNGLVQSVIKEAQGEEMPSANGKTENAMLGQNITCKRCKWSWNTADSDKTDKYTCHKCGECNSPKKVKIGGILM
jgi:hypothetical protein